MSSTGDKVDFQLASSECGWPCLDGSFAINCHRCSRYCWEMANLVRHSTLSWHAISLRIRSVLGFEYLLDLLLDAASKFSQVTVFIMLNALSTNTYVWTACLFWRQLKIVGYIGFLPTRWYSSFRSYCSDYPLVDCHRYCAWCCSNYRGSSSARFVRQCCLHVHTWEHFAYSEVSDQEQPVEVSCCTLSLLLWIWPALHLNSDSRICVFHVARWRHSMAVTPVASSTSTFGVQGRNDLFHAWYLSSFHFGAWVADVLHWPCVHQEAKLGPTSSDEVILELGSDRDCRFITGFESPSGWQRRVSHSVSHSNRTKKSCPMVGFRYLERWRSHCTMNNSPYASLLEKGPIRCTGAVRSCRDDRCQLNML